MHECLRRTIDDLYALSKVADKEDAERIQEIIECLQILNEHDDEQADIYMKLFRT